MDAKLFRGWLHQLGELSDRQRDQLKHRLLGGEATFNALTGSPLAGLKCREV